MKIRTDFVTNSSSSSFCVINIKSKELAEYLSSIENEGYIRNVYISEDAVVIKCSGGNGAESIEDVKEFCYNIIDNLSCTAEQIAEIYGEWDDCYNKWTKEGKNLSKNEIDEIIYSITYYEEPKEVREKLTELLKNAKSVDYEGASFTSD